LFGGLAGIIPSGLVGGLGNMATKGAEDLWYQNISNSGKAYLQGKDVSLKCYKLYKYIKDIDIKQAEKIYKTSSELEDMLEKINLDNDEKTDIEKLIQKIEEKTGTVLDKVKKEISEKSPIELSKSEIIPTIDNTNILDKLKDSEGRIRII
jgi:hypothetical protein